MTTPQPYQPRVRINVSTSVRGVKTFDVTVELADSSNLLPDVGNAALAESDRLVALLDARYPKEA